MPEKSEPLTRSPVAMSSTSNPQVITLSAAQRLQRAVDSGAMERTTQVHRKQKTVVGKRRQVNCSLYVLTELLHYLSQESALCWLNQLLMNLYLMP